ncbi:HWE histidine kinase domain-containing protein [uncultured Tateyamaria sp.]|uniref:HWE histidine kinase domain-containing protein n=1 Tax=uncultured Tateyamaria sp. TaxID=455651 RepID=UPI002612CAA8|nr:HWE histidine kinase domain-containing protein [uncultured Tateyamaria sp.]
MTLTADELRQALDRCSEDPIHIPGRIQGFGLLVALDAFCETIECISDNCAPILGAVPDALVGGAADTVFSAEELHGFRNALSHDTIERQREVQSPKTIGDVTYAVSLYRAGTRAVIEMIPEPAHGQERGGALHQAQSFLTSPLDFNDLPSFFDRATERLRALCGFDRVKFYQFLPDGSGMVVAEARHPDVASYLGLRFPESDIPRIARTLYARTPIRVLSDIMGPDAGVVGLPGAEPLDMSLAVLRGKDAVHRQYLENMGVGATMTVPVVVDGALWGLFAAHHMTAKTVDPNTLVGAELAGKLISLRIQHALESRRQQARNQCFGIANRLVVLDDSELAAGAYWDAVRDEVAALIACDGVAMVLGGQVLTYGETPPVDACRSLLQEAGDAPLTAVNDLGARMPDVDWGQTGGALAARVPEMEDASVVFFRDRIDQIVRWAGAPEKTVTVDDGRPRLDPRASFDSYVEQNRDQSSEWTAAEIELAQAFCDALSQVLATQKRLSDNRHRMGLMVRELNHRVHNILALVQSLASQSRQDSTSIEAYAAALERRIVALAGAHNLLTRADMQGAMLADLILLELRPYEGELGRVTIDGPQVVLRPDAASVIALIMHELTSNAAKYGALSVPKGRVTVNWRLNESVLELLWVESRGPPVVAPTHTGFGTTIVADGIGYEFNGVSDLQFLPGGVEVRLQIPADVVVDGDVPQARQSSRGAKPEYSEQPAATFGGRALLVEDNFIVAMQSRKILQELGFSQIDSANSIADALACIDAETYDFCLLDVNLHGEICTPVAARLQSVGTPFVFATGYGSDALDMVEGLDALWVAKPIETSILRVLLTDLLRVKP